MNELRPVDALLAIDVGNTRIGIAAWDSDGLHDVQHVATARPEQWADALRAAWSSRRENSPPAVVIGSVVPEATRQVMAAVDELWEIEPLRVRDDLPFPMPLKIENPGEVGVDRICSAAAAYERIQGACAVASFGTATTIDCVSSEGSFLGGAILPGLDMCCDALHEHTAQLPRVRPAAPNGPFARNTHDAIVNGVSYAAAGALREIVERFATELREWPQLVVTGGHAPIVSALADFVDAVVPDLCLIGVALTYRRAVGQD